MRNLTANPCGWCGEKAISTRTVRDGTPTTSGGDP